MSARPNLAFSATANTDVVVASDLEVNRPKPKPEQPRTVKPRRNVASVASEPVARSVTEPALVEVQQDHAVRPDSASPVIAVMPPKIEEAPRASAPPVQPSPEPSVPAAGGRGTLPPGDVMDGGRPVGGPGVIVVRGGGSGHDPCRIHEPGRGDIGGGIGDAFGGVGRPAGGGIGAVVGRGPSGVLVNDRAPRIGGGYPRGGIR